MADFCEVLKNVWAPSQQKIPYLSEWLPLSKGIYTHQWMNCCVYCVCHLLMLKKSALCPHGVFMGFVCYQTALICQYSISWFVFVTDKECFYERCELNVWNINQSNEMILSANPESNILYLVSPVKNAGSCEAVLCWRHSFVAPLRS